MEWNFFANGFGWCSTNPGTPRLEAGGAATPSTFILVGQEGQELPFIWNSFHLSYLLKGHFPALQTVWFKKIFLGDTKFKDQNLPLWRNIQYIYIDVPLEKALLPCPRYVQAFLHKPSFRSTRYTFFYKKLFSPSTETFLTFSQFRHQNFLKTFTAKKFELHSFAHAH